MITFTTGDIFQCKVQAIVNPVNCVGVMGKGLALSFKHRYPQNFKVYEKACTENRVKTGEMLIYATGLSVPQYIINFPTKLHWRDPSRIEYIENGLVGLKNIIVKLNIQSIAIPALGAGLGGLDWNVVKNLIVSSLQDLDTDIIVYEPLKI